jgi:hypothetical protein
MEEPVEPGGSHCPGPCLGDHVLTRPWSDLGVDVHLVRSFREIALLGDRGEDPVMPWDRSVLVRVFARAATPPGVIWAPKLLRCDWSNWTMPTALTPAMVSVDKACPSDHSGSGV